MQGKTAASAPGARARRVLLAAAALVALATGVAPARGQDAQAQAAGRQLFNEAVVLFNRGDYETACAKLEASLRAYPGIGTRGKLAECYEKVGKLASAWLAYREVAQLATRSGDATREQVASERAKALEPKLSYLTVVLPPSHDVSGLVIRKNGRELERTKIGVAEPMDPGTVTFDLAAPGKKTQHVQVTLKEGISVKFEVPTLKDEGAPTSAPPPAAPAPRDDAPSAQGDPPQWQKPVGLGALGLGAVGIGVGAAFGLSAKSTYDGAFKSGGGCRTDNTCNAAGQEKVDDARSKASLATVLVVVGGLVAATGLVVWVTAPSASSSSRASLWIAPSVGGAAVGGTL